MCPITKLILHPENFLSSKDIIFVVLIYRPVYLTALKFPIDQLHGLLHIHGAEVRASRLTWAPGIEEQDELPELVGCDRPL